MARPIEDYEQFGARFAEFMKHVQVRSDEECEAADLVVCGPWSYFDDDIKSHCAECNAVIYHRPHVPKRPPKVCMECAVIITKRNQAAEEENSLES